MQRIREQGLTYASQEQKSVPLRTCCYLSLKIFNICTHLNNCYKCLRFHVSNSGINYAHQRGSKAFVSRDSLVAVVIPPPSLPLVWVWVMSLVPVMGFGSGRLCGRRCLTNPGCCGLWVILFLLVFKYLDPFTLPTPLKLGDALTKINVNPTIIDEDIVHFEISFLAGLSLCKLYKGVL